MKFFALLSVALACVSCGNAQSSKDIPPCQADTLALAYSCGPASQMEYDDQGRQLSTYYMDKDGDRTLLNRDRECIIDTGPDHFHCMPVAYCAARCDGTNTVCEGIVITTEVSNEEAAFRRRRIVLDRILRISVRTRRQGVPRHDVHRLKHLRTLRGVREGQPSIRDGKVREDRRLQLSRHHENSHRRMIPLNPSPPAFAAAPAPAIAPPPPDAHDVALTPF